MAMPTALVANSGGDVEFDTRVDVGRMPVGMVVPTVILIVVGLGMTVLAGPIFGYTERAAEQVLDRPNYISAVLEDPT